MIEMGKQYRTRDGREVRIYATDGNSEYQVHGATNEKGVWHVREWTSKGWWRVGIGDDGLDLIEVKPRIKRTVWLNVYLDSSVRPYYYNNKAEADMGADHSRIACVKVEIDCEEGEGLQ
jgi:hypothetical protein